MLHINNVFNTIQGEGLYAGTAAMFVRMPFCNLACPWCDTEFNSFTKWTEVDFKQFAECSKTRFAVITGGEPSMNKDTPKVIEILSELGFMIAMESNGQFKAPEGVNHLTVSPKRWRNKNLTDLSHPFWFTNENEIGELKLVIDGEDALEAADTILLAYKNGAFKFSGEPNFFLSPEWNEKEKWMPKIIEKVQNEPIWRVSLQTHKIMEVL